MSSPWKCESMEKCQHCQNILLTIFLRSKCIQTYINGWYFTIIHCYGPNFFIFQNVTCVFVHSNLKWQVYTRMTRAVASCVFYTSLQLCSFQLEMWISISADCRHCSPQSYCRLSLRGLKSAIQLRIDSFTPPKPALWSVTKLLIQLNLHKTDLLSHHLTWHCSSIYEYSHRFAQIWSQNCFCYCFWTILGAKQ